MGTTWPGGAPRHRRLLGTALAAAVLAGLSAPLALPAAAMAHSVPQPDDGVVRTVDTTPAVGLLERRVRQREKALASIEQQAARYAVVKAEEVSRLAALGYTGALADLTHVLPLAGYYLSAGYGQAGPHWESTHTGQDFAAPLGTTLVAVGDAVVTSVGDAGAYGLRTVLTLEDGTEIWYCHQLVAHVAAGDTVEVGQPVGGLGTSGNSTGPHLHLEVRPPATAPGGPDGLAPGARPHAVALTSSSRWGVPDRRSRATVRA